MSHIKNVRKRKPMIPENPPSQVKSNARGSLLFRKSTANSDSKIRVMLRCKGNSNLASINSQKDLLQPSDTHPDTEIILTPNNMRYEFDHIFNHKTTQEQVYEKVAEPVLQEVLKGFNCTIFAYGQTGTGKTYTMEGDLEEVEGLQERNAGIIPRTIRKLFDELKTRDPKSHVMVSMLELYNEELRDLLCGAEGERKPLSLADDGTGTTVKNVKEIPIASAKKGLEIMKEGVRRRMTAKTDKNEKSSRSHCIFTITVYLHAVGQNGEGVFHVGKLNLVDLAGSENSRSSGSVGTRQRETSNINRSLLTLGRVINSLVAKNDHIPYRESKLTRLLKDSLGGQTKTYIIATVSPDIQCYDELRSTLDYASRASSINNQPQSSRPIHQERHVDILLKMLDATHEELRMTQERIGVYIPKKQYDTMKNEISFLKDQTSTKDIEIQEYKNLEKQHKEQIKSVTDEYKSKIKEIESEINLIRKEKEDLIVQHKEREHNLEMDFKLKQRKIESDFKIKEQKYIEAMKEKDDKHDAELQAERRRYEELVKSTMQFRVDLNNSNNAMWEAYLSNTKKINNSSHSLSPQNNHEVTVNEPTPVDTSSGVVPSTVNQIIPILPSDAANKKLLRNDVPGRLSNINGKYSKKRPLEDSSFNLPRAKK